jgi:hypothetical protein
MKTRNDLQGACFHIIYQDAKLKIIYHYSHLDNDLTTQWANITIDEILNIDN